MADDLNYGYKGADVPQSFGNNKGVFDPADINNLVKDDKWTNYGQLELIETQTVTGVSTVDFTNLGNYNVHFLTFNNVQYDVDSRVLYLRFSDDGGTSFITNLAYHRANQQGNSAGSFTEDRVVNQTYIRLQVANGGTGTGESASGYVYLYNLLDSSKYSTTTQHITQFDKLADYSFNYGAGTLYMAGTHNALRLFPNADNFQNATFSLYGIKSFE